MALEIRVVDAHVGGAPVRLVVGGAPTPKGPTMEKRCAWLARHAEALRAAATLEPRGHVDIVGALLTEPVTPGADAGLIGMDRVGYGNATIPTLIAAATIAIERGLLVKAPSEAGEGRTVPLLVDTVAGPVRVLGFLARPDEPARLTRMHLAAPQAWVVRAGHEVRVGERRLRVDLAWAGGLYAVLDGEAAGLPLVPDRLEDVRRLGRALCDAVGPLRAGSSSDPAALAGVVFTGPPRAADAHLRLAAVTAEGVCDRSGLSGAAAVVSLLHGMGLAGAGEPIVFESVHGVRSEARIDSVVQREDQHAVESVVMSSAWITGEGSLFVSDADPLTNDA